MIIGVLKENKVGESRVILTPTEVSELTMAGNKLLVQKDAGTLAGYSDADFVNAGAEMVDTMAQIYERSEMVTKVKEIFPEEYDLLRKDQIVFCCVHPAAHPEEVDALLAHKTISFSAEDTHRFGSPNCEVAGKLGALMGCYHLLSINGGSGKLFCGIAGCPGAKAIVIGAGIVGKACTEVLAGMGVQVTLMDINVGILRQCDLLYPKNVQTAISNQSNIKALLPSTDIVYNCVKWPKESKTHLITRDMLKLMRKGSVIVDISADVGGAIETYEETTHEHPTHVVDGIIHYGVSNIPGAAPYTTSISYAASIYPHLRAIAGLGIKEACRRDGFLRRSLTTYNGILTHPETSVIQNRPWETPESILGLEGAEGLDVVPSATTTRAKKK